MEKSSNKVNKTNQNKIIQKNNRTKVIGITRFNPDPNFGLKAEQIQSRVEEGLTNSEEVTTSKSYKKIFFKNIFTFFNMICFIVALALISVGSFKNLTFLIIVIINTLIGIIQEIKAKKTMDKLSLTNSNFTKVIREGEITEIYKKEVVLDEVLCLNSGMQIAADSIVLSGEIEVNESLITGESLPIKKKKGDSLLAGSFISSGTCRAKVDKIGGDNYIEKLTQKAKKYTSAKSEMLSSMNLIIRVIAVIIIPLAALTYYNNYIDSNGDTFTIVTRTAGSIVAMIPTGMFLLASMALATSVIRLSKKRTLVQELYCIEMLARANVLCLDKTGTLTDGSMVVKEMVNINKSITDSELKKVMASIVNAFHDANHTAMALKSYFGSKSYYSADKKLPFSSERKFMACKFGKTSYKVGAFEYVDKKKNPQIEKMVNEYSAKGMRVLLVAKCDSDFSDAVCDHCALIVLEDNIRKDAEKTIRWFKENSVDIKVISGDNPVTVSEIARRVGIEGYEKYISLQGLSKQDVIQAASEYNIFGRVSPEQKATLVKALKAQGKTVAMTGDGVNDILALKEADCSIAIAAGSEAARSVSQLVLLDSNFSSMPSVVQEGRRVVNNVQNSSTLYLMKTIFAIVFTIFVLIIGTKYPFETIQMLILEFLVIGAPSWFLAVQPNHNIIKGRFLANIFKTALPAGSVLTLSVISMYVYQHFFGISDQVLTTMASLILVSVGFVILFKVCRPFTVWKGIMYSVVIIVAITAVSLFPTIFNYVTTELKFQEILYMIVITFVSYPLYSILVKAYEGLRNAIK